MVGFKSDASMSNILIGKAGGIFGGFIGKSAGVGGNNGIQFVVGVSSGIPGIWADGIISLISN